MDHPGRTIVVMTRHSNGALAVTYCNNLDGARPYLMTTILPTNDVPIGFALEQLPGAGETRHFVLEAGELP